MKITIRKFNKNDIESMISIWNEVVEDGIAFPQIEGLNNDNAYEFFLNQSYSAVAEDEDANILGLYILHPNNIGRCGHLSNASYAVKKEYRGLHIGEQLVLDCINKARELNFKVLQFNAVVASNIHARHLYERIGFTYLNTIKGGFKLKDGTYEDICLYCYYL